MELEKGKETIEMDMRDIRAFHAWLGANQKFCDTNQKFFNNYGIIYIKIAKIVV